MSKAAWQEIIVEHTFEVSEFRIRNFGGLGLATNSETEGLGPIKSSFCTEFPLPLDDI